MSSSTKNITARRLLLGAAVTVLFCVGSTLVIAGGAPAASGLSAGVVTLDY